MGKNNCTSLNKNNGSGEYAINCAGEKVFVPDRGFTSRCAIGNTGDYLKSFENHINDEFVSLGDPALISVVIPSYASNLKDLCGVIRSLYMQDYPVPAEILVFINEPDNASESIRRINNQNEKFILSIRNDEINSFSPEMLKIQKELIEMLKKRGENVELRCIRQVVSGGLAGVYQVVTASLTARVREYCDSITSEDDRESRIKCIEKYFQSSMLLLCDDDMKIKDSCAVAKAYKSAVEEDSVVLGNLHIESVDTVREYSNVLRDLMQLFFDFKYDKGLNFLTPRGIVLSDVLSIGGVNVGQPFADQLFFASIASTKTQYLIDASTAIGESNYPGNGSFLKELRKYLEGENNDALDIFYNVLKRYKEDNHNGKYCVLDIENLISALKTRNINKISSISSDLLLAS